MRKEEKSLWSTSYWVPVRRRIGRLDPIGDNDGVGIVVVSDRGNLKRVGECELSPSGSKVDSHPIMRWDGHMPSEVQLPLCGIEKVVHNDEDAGVDDGALPLCVKGEIQLRVLRGEPCNKRLS